MESVEGEVPKMEELKIAEVGKKDHDIKYKASTAPPVRPERLQFKDIPLDMKRMIFSYVRTNFLDSCSLSVNCNLEVCRICLSA